MAVGVPCVVVVVVGGGDGDGSGVAGLSLDSLTELPRSGYGSIVLGMVEADFISFFTGRGNLSNEKFSSATIGKHISNINIELALTELLCSPFFRTMTIFLSTIHMFVQSGGNGFPLSFEVYVKVFFSLDLVSVVMYKVISCR